MSDTSDGSLGEILLYELEDGRTRVECRFVNETLWLSQALIGALFQKDVCTINEHLTNIYEEGELAPEATIRKFRIVRQEGARQVARMINHYNLEALLAVGYRVLSPRGVQFRRWASEPLGGYLVKGFTMDDARLKSPPAAGSEVPDYFDKLLARIRDIRASEQRLYLRVRETFRLRRRLCAVRQADRDVLPDHTEQAAFRRNRPDGGSNLFAGIPITASPTGG